MGTVPETRDRARIMCALVTAYLESAMTLPDDFDPEERHPESDSWANTARDIIDSAAASGDLRAVTDLLGTMMAGFVRKAAQVAGDDPRTWWADLAQQVSHGDWLEEPGTDG